MKQGPTLVERSEFDTYCGSLPATTHVVQWGGASVWKVGGKIFAICSNWGDGEGHRFSFKCTDLSYQILSEQDGLAPAPYLARAKWIQLQDLSVMSDPELCGYIDAAHAIVAGTLTRTKREELGLS